MEDVCLNNTDYKDILQFYNIDYTSSNKEQIKQNAENIIASKLCQCINKLDKVKKVKSRPYAVAICNNSILKKHNLKYYGFSCKKKPSLKISKRTKTRKCVKGARLTKNNSRYPLYSTTKTRRKSRR